jgi:hypothetical protein
LRSAISCGRDQPLWRALIGPSRKSMRVIGTVGQLAEKNKNRLIVDAQENLGALTADSLRLKQILCPSGAIFYARRIA